MNSKEDQIVRQFASDHNLGVRKGRGRSSYGECEAWYELYRKNWLGFKNHDYMPLLVHIGVFASRPLLMGDKGPPSGVELYVDGRTHHSREGLREKLEEGFKNKRW